MLLGLKLIDDKIQQTYLHVESVLRFLTSHAKEEF